jgi:hypothetical protein
MYGVMTFAIVQGRLGNALVAIPESNYASCPKLMNSFQGLTYFVVSMLATGIVGLGALWWQKQVQKQVEPSKQFGGLKILTSLGIGIYGSVSLLNASIILTRFQRIYIAECGSYPHGFQDTDTFVSLVIFMAVFHLCIPFCTAIQGIADPDDAPVINAYIQSNQCLLEILPSSRKLSAIVLLGLSFQCVTLR